MYTYTVMSCISAHFGSQSFWSDKWNVRISEADINYQDGSHTKCTGHETTRL